MPSTEELISRFSIADYVIFALMLLISAAIGIYYACSGGKQKTTDEFLLADRSLRVVPVAMSILASFMSAIALLGTPSEVYLFGGQYWLILIAYTFMCAGSCYLYLPIFYKLQLVSVNEYLELRFNHTVRCFGCILFVFQMTLYMAIVLYTPALALSQVTGIPIWGSVLSTAIVCTFYTTIGGMKAVVWTDAFQVTMMFLAIFTVCIKGCIDVGGIHTVWEVNKIGHRLDFIDFDPDPTVRHSMWAIAIGGYFTWVSIYGVNQAMVQRYLSIPTLRKAQLALWVNYPMLLVLITITSFGGLVLYAKYQLCDPISTKQISANDQIFPLFVMETLGEFPGIPGIFVAGVFSGALSTVSSGVNSLSAVTLEDIIKPYFLKSYSEDKATKITKILALSYGLVCIVLVAVAQQLGNVLQAALSIFGMIGGPLLGVFTLGIFFPHANTLGAIVGTVCSLIVSFWIGIGSFLYRPPTARPPISVSGCAELYLNATKQVLGNNQTVDDLLISVSSDRNDDVLFVYRLSYLWLSFIAVIVAVIIGLIVSFISGKQDPRKLKPGLICPVFDIFCCCLPKKLRKMLHCNANLESESLNDDQLEEMNELSNVS